jgi:hypothetical protein
MQSFIRLESFNVVIVNSVFLNSESFGTVSNRVSFDLMLRFAGRIFLLVSLPVDYYAHIND